jgi:hypothetical protein
MTTDSITTTIGTNDFGHFIGDGDCRIQFTEEEMNALHFAQIHSETLANAFVNFCSMTFASGSIPSCFRQDLTPEEVKRIQEELPVFQRNFGNAFFNLMLIFEY